MDTPFFLWFILPALIILARVTDVTIGTLRIIFVMRSVKWLAALLGFVEVFIWIIVISRLMSHSTNIIHYAAYAAGFALGNLIGIAIEEKLAIGYQTVRAITMQDIESLVADLKEHGFGATIIPAFGIRGGRTTILFTTVRRRNVGTVLGLLQQHTPRAFVAVEDVRSAREGVFPVYGDSRLTSRLFPFARKGK